MHQERVGARELAVGLPASLVAGLLVGVLGTFKHQFGVSAATGSGPPIGLVASIAMVGLLLAALRLAFPTRWFALAAALGVLVGVGVLLLPGAGGSQVVLDNYAGLTWTAAPAVVAAAVVGWPRRSAPRPRPAREGAVPARSADARPADEILVDGQTEGRVR